MATINVYSSQGNLSKSIDAVIAATSPYANLTYEARIENVLNYYQTINELVSIDYGAGGYLNYGLLNDGRFAVDLDNYQLRYTGTFGYSSSKVDKIEAIDLSTNIKYTIEGSLDYSGVPFFSSINSGSKISAIGSFSSNYEYARINLDGTYTPNGNITGTLKGVGSGYIKSGIAYLEVLEGGNSTLARINGVFDISPSELFTKAFVGTISTSSGNIIDSISSENIAFPLNRKVSDINLYEGNDTFTLTGSKGSVIYAGNGNDLIEGSNYSDSMFGEFGNDTLNGGDGDDMLDGGDGDDMLDGGAGNDVISGGFGIDYAIYNYSYDPSNYTIVYSGGTYTISGLEGIDTITGVERFAFDGIYYDATSFIDTTAPTISISTNDSSLTVGETATISFTLSESSSNFALADVTASGGSLSNFSGSGTSYSARFTPASNSTTNGVVSVASGSFTDTAGNNNVDGLDTNNTVTMTVNTIPSNNSPTGLVSIKGRAIQNQKLTASHTLKDADGMGTVTYQWNADGSAISGANTSTFTLTQAQVGKAITVVASYTDRAGNAESVASSSTASVTNVNDKPTGAVTISGTASQGQVLTASNTLADLDGLGTISYAWYASKTLLGTGSTYTLTQNDVGKAITVTARYTDLQGIAESSTSRATAKVANVNDAPTVANIIPTQTVVEGAPFSFNIPTNTFTDLDKDKLTYSATFNGSAMTSSTWGQLSKGKFTSKQVPYTAADTTDNTIVLTASDGKGGSVSTSFTLRVTNTANINGTSKADTINAGAGADTINGLAGNDIISGGVGNDIIDGGAGNDRLTGGLDSADYFRFTTAIKSNIDTITDFVSGTDKIQLDDAIFTRFAGISVQSTHLVVGSSTVDVKATQLDDYLLYNTSTGQLYYDADGNGKGNALQFATLVGVATLTVDDFTII